MQELKLPGMAGECSILVGESISNLANYCNGRQAAIVTDSNLLRFHGGAFPKLPVIEVGTGEGSKTLATVEKVYESMLQLGLDRSSMLVGIGGGIVCDVAGFAASTYLRGISFGFVPTTLIAQSDAAVGGKNGVNLHGYKNLVGTIRQPEFVLCDFALLKTLPQRELACGFAEIIKCAAIADVQLFAYLEEHLPDALALKRAAIEKAVNGALAVKVKIVSEDEMEKGGRMKLNFGHTLGHAIEKTFGLPHGEAISIGMAAAARISCARGMLPRKDAERVEELLASVPLPTKLMGIEEGLMDAIEKDKKRAEGNIRMCLLEGIGRAKIAEVGISELEAVLDDLR
jgi:3-dehydroquinate synthase